MFGHRPYQGHFTAEFCQQVHSLIFPPLCKPMATETVVFCPFFKLICTYTNTALCDCLILIFCCDSDWIWPIICSLLALLWVSAAFCLLGSTYLLHLFHFLRTSRKYSQPMFKLATSATKSSLKLKRVFICTQQALPSDFSSDKNQWWCNAKQISRMCARSLQLTDYKAKLSLHFAPTSHYQVGFLPNWCRTTAILYWTYPDELTNDPSFRVNQKWMAVKPHVAVRKWRNTTARFVTWFDR